MLQRSKIIRIGQIAIASFLLFQIIFSYAGQGTLVARAQVPGGLKPATSGVTGQVPVYQGVDTSISKYLCTPDDSNLGGSLFICITKVYRFGVAFGAIALVFFVVLAGYFYITGGEGAKTKGKSIFTSALTGMVIILGSYVLLGFINPSLLKIRPIQPPIFSASNLPRCSDVGLGIQCVLPDGNVNLNGSNGGSGGGQIAMTNGCKQCVSGNGTVAYFQNTCLKDNAEVASFVAAGESSCGGNIYNTTTGACSDGNPAMVGMFQINLTVHKLPGLDCPTAFSGGGFTAQNHNCKVKDQALYKQCKDYASDHGHSIENACRLITDLKARGRKTWYPTWQAADCLHNKGLDNFK